MKCHSSKGPTEVKELARKISEGRGGDVRLRLVPFTEPLIMSKLACITHLHYI